MARVLVTTAYADPEPLATFRRFVSLDRFGAHQPVTDAHDADVILFVENSHYADDYFYRRLKRHRLVKAHREKCFMYNEKDRVWCVLPGLYPSICRRHYDPSRVRSGAYVQVKNPLVGAAETRRIEPDLLFSFMGQVRSPLRRALMRLGHPRACLEDTSGAFQAFSGDPPRWTLVRRYAEVVGRSRFVLCPRGGGQCTFRLFETLSAGRVPVILADQWVPPRGPAWEEFSVRVPEREIESIPARLEQLEHDWVEMGRRARLEWERWFSPEVLFHRMVETCLELKARRRLPEWLRQRLPTRGGVEVALRFGLGRLRSGARCRASSPGPSDSPPCLP
jgi:hypothetical protein